ncbi:MAG: hypothetical protein IPK82_33750 [Polyangiaceae bacterium]|nr:hypothetical protein [Polyangiaceae bacterium]
MGGIHDPTGWLGASGLGWAVRVGYDVMTMSEATSSRSPKNDVYSSARLHRVIAFAAGLLLAGAGTAAAVYWKVNSAAGTGVHPAAPPLPSQENRWVNGTPLTVAAPGQVLLIEAWHPA